jgi:hypothetical protein
MKRKLLLFLLTAGLAGTGCLGAPDDRSTWMHDLQQVKDHEAARRPAPAPQAESLPPGPPPVTEREVTAANAPEVLDALKAEVAGAEQQPVPQPATVVEQPRN